MANYQYSGDLVDDILFRCGEATDGTSDFNATALQYLNRAYQGVWMGGAELVPDLQEDWWWLRKYPPGVLVLQPAITDGSVLVTNNSTAITFSSAPSVSVANRFFKVDDEEDVFRISAHTAGQQNATLDAEYTGESAAAASYRVMKLEYDLASDILRPIAPMRAYRAERLYEIDGIDALALDKQWPLALTDSGVPDTFAMVGETKVRFNRYGGLTSTDLIRAEYDYLYRPDPLTDSTTEEPVVPRQWRKMLSDWATGWLMIDKNDDRAANTLVAAKAGLTAMALENRHKQQTMSGNRFGAIRPRQDQYQPWVQGPVRTQSGLIVG